MKKHTTLLLCQILTICAFGQDLPMANPDEVGLSPGRLQRIDKAVSQHIEENHIAGAVTMIGRKGKIVWYASHGSMDKELGKAMQKDAIFQLASMTKPLTATAVMMLYEQGHYLLSDPISKYIPEF